MEKMEKKISKEHANNLNKVLAKQTEVSHLELLLLFQM